MRTTAPEVRAINNNKAYRMDLRRFEKIAARVMSIIRKDKAADLELVFISDAEIKKLNKRYKSSDRYTDVLSFRLEREEFGYKRFLGEIIISLDTARKNSSVYGVSLVDEAALYVIHGILHLFGYDDEYPADRRRMEKKQLLILGEICRSENLSGALTPR